METSRLVESWAFGQPENICPEGEAWIRSRIAAGRGSLHNLWWDCPNGCWLAWWLKDARKVDAVKIRQSASLRRNHFSGGGWTPEKKLEFAQEIRRHFAPSGRRLR